MIISLKLLIYGYVKVCTPSIRLYGKEVIKMSSDFLKLVGERIRTIRKEKGYTQESLSEKSGIHVTYISDIERGERNISMETLEKVITALDISPVDRRY